MAVTAKGFSKLPTAPSSDKTTIQKTILHSEVTEGIITILKDLQEADMVM